MLYACVVVFVIRIGDRDVGLVISTNQSADNLDQSNRRFETQLLTSAIIYEKGRRIKPALGNKGDVKREKASLLARISYIFTMSLRP